ncbi:LacI family DNA-binding transcriptional regulator [Actinomyces faecalis]|uniref:LacI family DNA-binding transcriptional regulator n=1 Tax=Actinomyces faecalis TaxID=2722820 RepID=UPI0015564F13|nr:LacI family DNA-binding transcriptional regulator [Actinomyces faecalis]
MTTLRDVAQRAGVSAMTVSNVVNGRSGKVSQATIERVEAAIRELGYVPNAQARTLAGASSRIIALVYGVSPERAPLSAPHESLFVGACEQACHEAGLAVMLCACVDEDADALLQRLRGWNVAGAIVMGTTPTDARARLSELGVPVVAIDSRSAEVAELVQRQGGEAARRLGAGSAGSGLPEGGDQAQAAHGWASLASGFFTVGIDDAGGGALAGRHLCEAGHARVVFVAPYPRLSRIDIDRLAGLREGLGARGQVRVVEAAVDYSAAVEVGARLARSMKDAGESAVFASADLLAIGIVAGLRRSGVRVPDDVSVVGFDGFEISTYSDPVLTAVVQPIADKAGEAVRLIQGAPEREIVLPVSWREGGTLGPAR